MSGMSPWAMLGSARRDRSVVEQKLSRETVRRVVGFALPHRALIAGFLVFVVLDAALVVVNPLLIKHLLDDGILGQDTSLVVWLALAMAVVVDPRRRARRRLGLPLLAHRREPDLRPAHQGVRPRAADVAGVLHPHPDRRAGLAAQQRRHRRPARLHLDPVEHGLQLDQRGRRRASPCSLLSWQVTLACLALFPLLLLASRWVGRQISGLTRRQMDGNADLGNLMTERFNVGGALLLKLFGRRDEEDAKYAEKAGLVRDLGIRISLVTRVFMAHDDADPGARDRARLRHRRRPRDQRRADDRHADRARHPAAAAARPARRGSPTCAST